MLGRAWKSLLGLFALLLLGTQTRAFASEVVINEFLVDPDSSQWVELYNKGQESVTIGGWFIDDNGGTQKFTIPQDTTINPREFKAFESSAFNLNRTSSDTVRLLQGDSVVDSFDYTTGPGTNASFGRLQDGSSDWVVFSDTTKGSSNNFSSPFPTATQPPEPTNTPTKTPSPTKTPTPTKTPVPPKPSVTPKPTATPKKTAIPTKAQVTQNSSAGSPTKVISNILGAQTDSKASAGSEKSYPTAILNAKTEPTVDNSLEEVTASQETRVLRHSRIYWFGILSVAGISVLIYAILFYLKHRQNV